MDSKKLRARKLASLANKELTNDNLRALFRLLDDDGSHEVSSATCTLADAECHESAAASELVVAPTTLVARRTSCIT